VSRADRNEMVCRYRRHIPIFYIRPLKEELLNANPKVIVFHDVITDAEIAKIKELATPKVHHLIVSTRYAPDRTWLMCIHAGHSIA